MNSSGYRGLPKNPTALTVWSVKYSYQPINISDEEPKKQMEEEFQFLYDDTEDTKTRFVSFVGKENRYDLVIIMSGRFYGKHLILHLQSNKFAIIGPDDLNEPGYIEEAYSASEEEADELRSFLHTIVNPWAS